MKRNPQYAQGHRAATKAAVEWLHQRAREMNDPHARQVLNSAAFSFGQERAADKRAAARPAPVHDQIHVQPEPAHHPDREAP